jgi:2-C-methyl-D-erythritol 2,4-cyclodiphosphate synthase
MCQKIAAALGLPVDRVNMKATTNEKLGFIGRGDGIAALAVAALDVPE